MNVFISKDGEFGLTLRTSLHKQSRKQTQFIHEAEKVLSRIDLFQKLEESSQVGFISHLPGSNGRRIREI